MESLTPIPTPPAQQWQRWKNRLVHVLFFAVLCALVFWTWRRVLRPPEFQGQAELIQVMVTTPDAGLLTNMWAELHQEVRAGDVLAELITTDPRTVNSRLSLLRNRMQLLELEVDPTMMRQRASLEYERLVVESGKDKVALALAEITLQKAINDLDRNRKLHEAQVISDEMFDFFDKAQSTAEEHVNQLRAIVDYNEKAIERLSYLREIAMLDDQNEPVRRALKMEESRRQVFEDKIKPLPLVSPIDGVVTEIFHRAQENVLAGSTILTVTATKPTRIVGYLPLGFSIKPKLGMEVEIQTRAFQRQNGTGRVLGFGPQIETTSNVFNRIMIPPMGRPISVSLPKDLDLSPGEPVDMRFVE